MANEDSHFTAGPGRCFRMAATLVRRGADLVLDAKESIRVLRTHLRQKKHDGPAGLQSLAGSAGVCSDSGQIPFSRSETELDHLLDIHSREGIRQRREPEAAWESAVVRREWARLNESGARHRIAGVQREVYESIAQRYRGRIFPVEVRLD